MTFQIVKKYIFLLICLLAMTFQVQAQVAFATARELSIISRGVKESVRHGNALYVPGAHRVGGAGRYSFQISLALKRTERTSFAVANATQREMIRNNQSFRGATPVCKTLLKHRDDVLKVFPGIDKGLTDKQLCRMITIQENMTYIHEVDRIKNEILPNVEKLSDRFKNRVAQTKRPTDPITFAIEAVPQQVNTLFLGETHEFPAIQEAVGSFLQQLRRRHPQKKILFFTEFLPQGYVYENISQFETIAPSLPKSYQGVFKTALKEQMTVVGLEPEIVIWKEEPAILLTDAPRWARKKYGELFEGGLFTTLNGMKYRNEQFLKVLNEYRQAEPDALFVVYTGSAHSAYQRFASLADGMPAEQTFVLTLGVGHSLLGKDANDFIKTLLNSNFLLHRMKYDKQVDRTFLDFSNDKELAKYAGFDVYIEIEKPSN